jgi:hypothetical protein
VKFQIATAAAALLFIVAAWSVGAPQRTAALTGASIAGSTALVSIFALGRAARSKKNATLAALAVVVVLFLVRLVLVGVGTVLVGKSGAAAYVVAFFVPYFAFTAFEGAFLHSLRRSGTPA